MLFFESSNNKILWFADLYANFIFRNCEDNENSSDIIQNTTYFSEKRLYF